MKKKKSVAAQRRKRNYIYIYLLGNRQSAAMRTAQIAQPTLTTFLSERHNSASDGVQVMGHAACPRSGDIGSMKATAGDTKELLIQESSVDAQD